MNDLEQLLTDHLRRRADVATPHPDLDAVRAGTRRAPVIELDDRRGGLQMMRSTPVRWLAAAAAVILFGVAVAWARSADDQDLDTGPVVDGISSTSTTVVDTRPAVPQPATIFSAWGCPFGITGASVLLEPGPYGRDVARFFPEGGQGVAYTSLDGQVAEIHVPGLRAPDPPIRSEGAQSPSQWRIEDIELPRGTATVWLDGPESGPTAAPFVQVRWTAGNDEPCSSFTVTVEGGDEAANRRTAVDLAGRIVLPGENPALDLPGSEGGPVAGLELAGTEWGVLVGYSGPIDGEPGDTEPVLGAARMSFTDTTVSWNIGCAELTATYELDPSEGTLVLTDRTSTDPTCTPPEDDRSRLATAMSADSISVSYAGGTLVLGASSVTLVPA